MKKIYFVTVSLFLLMSCKETNLVQSLNCHLFEVKYVSDSESTDEIFTYNAQKQLIKITSNSKLSNEYDYSSDGYLTSLKLYDIDGLVYQSQNYTYINDKLAEEIIKGRNGVLFRTSKFSYDNLGNLLQVVATINYASGLKNYTQISTFSQNKQIEYKFTSNSNTGYAKFENGFIKQYITDSNTVDYSYDKIWRLVSMKNDINGIGKILYEFDYIDGNVAYNGRSLYRVVNNLPKGWPEQFHSLPIVTGESGLLKREKITYTYPYPIHSIETLNTYILNKNNYPVEINTTVNAVGPNNVSYKPSQSKYLLDYTECQ